MRNAVEAFLWLVHPREWANQKPLLSKVDYFSGGKKARAQAPVASNPAKPAKAKRAPFRVVTVNAKSRVEIRL